MKKIGLICLALVLALGALGVGYARWADNLYLEGAVTMGEVDWAFDNHLTPGAYPEVTQHDNGIDPLWGKEVGSTEWLFIDSDIDGDYDTLQLTILNAYPFYYNHLSTWVHCNGSVPIIIVGAWVSFDGGTEIWMPAGGWIYNNADPDLATLMVSFGDNYGDQLHFCDFRDISLDFQVLQPAQQGAQYAFSIRYEAVQYNEYTGSPPP